MKKKWTLGERVRVHLMFADTPTELLAAMMNRSVPSVERYAHRCGLRKSKERISAAQRSNGLKFAAKYCGKEDKR